MALAVEVASRSNCLRSRVGAIVLHGNRIRAVGYNGTIKGHRNCFDGGCPRCRDLTLKRGQDLDRCVCVHAEENALVSAARYGIPVEGAECYVTHEPCLSCTRLLIQAHVCRVVYLTDYWYPETKDHNQSRTEMRNSTSITKFEKYREVILASGDSEAVARADAWEERLDKMREDALAYGRAQGVLTETAPA